MKSPTKQIELLVRVNVTVPFFTNVENICIHIPLKECSLLTCGDGGSAPVESELNEYETLIIHEITP